MQAKRLRRRVGQHLFAQDIIGPRNPIEKTKGFPLPKTPLYKTETVFHCAVILSLGPSHFKSIFAEIAIFNGKPRINKLSNKIEPRGNLIVAVIVINVPINSLHEFMQAN